MQSNDNKYTRQSATDLIAAAHGHILVLDGALGTEIQKLGLDEKSFRGSQFANHSCNLKGCNDVLAITLPEAVYNIHTSYLEAGAHIISTDSFNANAISLADYALQDHVAEINHAAASLARRAADDHMSRFPGCKVWVAGSVGPSGLSLTMAHELNSPLSGIAAWDALTANYTQQIKALIEGGVDLLLIETQFDALNTRAILWSAQDAMEATGLKLPIIVSATLTQSGRLLSGHTPQAFSTIVKHVQPFAVGLNCGFGVDDMAKHLHTLCEVPTRLSVYPNAGLPDALGRYSDTPEIMAEKIDRMLNENAVNIVGGCCGTTPEHIKLIAEVAAKHSPRAIPEPNHQVLELAGLEKLTIPGQPNTDNEQTSFIKVGERCNVAGSRKFLRLLNEGNFDECTQIAASQVANGADIIDINTDDPLLDASEAMCTLLAKIGVDPQAAVAPVMIDTSSQQVMTCALKCVGGRPVVNSISLKEGEEAFLEKASFIRKMGAAVVVMAFDEQGQATTLPRRIEICQRAYRLLTERAGFSGADIIFDPNILTIATGIEQHNNYAVDFINCVAWIKENLPGAKVSGGVSNLSFAFRGNEPVRKAMHSLFLAHACEKGLDMAIVNVAALPAPEQIEPRLAKAVDDVVLNKSADAPETLMQIALEILEQSKSTSLKQSPGAAVAGSKDALSLHYLVLSGSTVSLAEAVDKALQAEGSAYAVISNQLMPAMETVGQRFGRGEMFLPQVVKSATVMKQAVSILNPVLQTEKENSAKTAAGTIVLATVKGDVHDIGKNIVATVLSCNGWHVIDMGVMVPGADIVEKAAESNVDAIGLSGLITPSLDEMMDVARLMQSANMHIPLFVGGAAASELHTALKIAPLYSGDVVFTADAASLPPALARFTGENRLEESAKHRMRQSQLVESKSTGQSHNTLEYARSHRPDSNPTETIAVKCEGLTDMQFKVSELIGLINWKAFEAAWKIASPHCDCCDNDHSRQRLQLREDAEAMLETIEDEKITARVVIARAHADKSDNIIVQKPGSDDEITFPMLRRQAEPFTSLADYVALANDHIGLFVVTVSPTIEELVKLFKDEDDEYASILLQSLADRLVEAATEMMHHRVRNQLWGFANNEPLPKTAIADKPGQGIRPAFGYPSLPDQSLVHIADKILNYKQLHIETTENGALKPSATTTGFIFADPRAKYFTIGAIGDDQRADYASRRGFSLQTLQHYLPENKY